MNISRKLLLPKLLTRKFTASAINKPKIVVIGSGWTGYRVAMDIDKSKYNVEVISPRNHFLFTPLLPSTTVGTLEFRCIQEPVRTIPNVEYRQASVTNIDFTNNMLHCKDAFSDGFDFRVHYDGLVLAPGSETNTLNVPGVDNNPNVFFLKQLSHSRAIRNRLIDCFERASSPSVIDKQTRRNLLTFLIVGGGPTSIEFAAELYDFLKNDVSKWYPDLYTHSRVKIVEASGHILGSFNIGLVNYVESLFKTRKIDVLTGTVVKEITDRTAHLSDDSEVTFGLAVWSTGIKNVPLIDHLSSKVVGKLARGRLKIDGHLRLLSASGEPIAQGRIFAAGDCAGDIQRPLPALAQVASQQGIYLAKMLNKEGLGKLSAGSVKPFKYQHLGAMASVGEWKGVFDSPNLENTRLKVHL